MAIQISTACKEARLVAVRDLIDSGSGNGVLRLYASARPAAGGTPSSSHLVEIQFKKPCGTVSGGKLNLEQLNTLGDVIITTGQAVWGRILTGAGDFVADGDVSDSAGSGDFKVGGTTGTWLYEGGSLQLGTTSLG